MHKKSAEAVLERLKDLLNESSDSGLARALKTTPQTLSSWKQRDSVPYAKCIEVAGEHEVTLDWLLTGQGEMSKGAASPQGPALSPKEESILALFNALSAADQREILAAAETKKQLKDKLEELDALIAQHKITG